MGIQARNFDDDSPVKREKFTVELDDQVKGRGSWCIPVSLATIADGDIVTTFTPGFPGQIDKVYAITTVVASTASKASTLNLEIGTTNVTGGTVALTTAACDTLGEVVAGAAITAANTFDSDDTISVEASSTTTFGEGEIVLVIEYTATHVETGSTSNISFGKLYPSTGNAQATFQVEDVHISTQLVGDAATAHTITADVNDGTNSVCGTKPSIAKTATAPANTKDEGTGETAAILSTTAAYTKFSAGEEMFVDITRTVTGAYSHGFGRVRVDVYGYWADEF